MVTIEVEGMTCGHCASTIKKAIADVAPGAEVDIDLTSKQVKVTGAPDADTLRTAIREAGYQPMN